MAGSRAVPSATLAPSGTKRATASAIVETLATSSGGGLKAPVGECRGRVRVGAHGRGRGLRPARDTRVERHRDGSAPRENQQERLDRGGCVRAPVAPGEREPGRTGC